jgi:DNA polymerase III epsilon subunit-like protein
MRSLNGHLLAAIDFETTGTIPGWHEVVQVAVVPLDGDLRPASRPFCRYVRPEHPERADPAAQCIHSIPPEVLEAALSAEKVADLLHEWADSLQLRIGQKLVPLAHNWAFEHSFLTAWLGEEQRDALFHYHARDAQSFAITLNDAASVAGRERPFPSVSLPHLCDQFKIVNTKPHDALADSIAEASLYRAMLKLCAFAAAS